MPPLSIRAISSFAEAVLQQVAPECLREPTAFPVLEVFESVLPRFNVHTYAVSDDDLPDAEAVTDHEGSPGDEITIRIRERQFDDLVAGRRLAFRPRATLSHELGHALLHVDVIRRRMQHPAQAQQLLRRTCQREMPTFEQSEWQAWTLGGCVLMPARTLSVLGAVSVAHVASVYQLSAAMARSHLRKMRKAHLLGRTKITDL
jgi:hypothetical protein